MGGVTKGGMSTYTRTPSYGGSGTPMYGSGTPGHGGRTPMYGSQTPMYDAGSRTPHYGSMTPSHGRNKFEGQLCEPPLSILSFFFQVKMVVERLVEVELGILM